jgi:hypothetical protein
MSEITSSDVRRKEAGETVNVIADFTAILEQDDTVNELISSVTSIVAAPTGPTISGSIVSTKPRKVNGAQVAAGKAIQFTVAGGTNEITYALACTIVTSGGQTRVRKLSLIVTAT